MEHNPVLSTEGVELEMSEKKAEGAKVELSAEQKVSAQKNWGNTQQSWRVMGDVLNKVAAPVVTSIKADSAEKVFVEFKIHAINSLDIIANTVEMDGTLYVYWLDESEQMRELEKEYVTQGRRKKRVRRSMQYNWNNGIPMANEWDDKEMEEKQVKYPGVVRTVLLNNCTQSFDLSEPYLTHYRETSDELPSGHKANWNVRYLSRKLYTMRLGDDRNQAACFPFDFHDVPIEFRMPRTSDRGLQLCWKTGIDKPYEKMLTVPKGLMFEETANAEWSFLYPRIKKEWNYDPVSYRFVTGSTRKGGSTGALTRDLRRLEVKVVALRKHGFYRVYWAITLLMGTCALYTHAIDAFDFAGRGEIDFLMLLTVVTFKFLIADDLPNIQMPSFLDYYMYFTIFMIFSIILENGLLTFASASLADRIDWIFYATYCGVWGLANIGFGFRYMEYHNREHLNPEFRHQPESLITLLAFLSHFFSCVAAPFLWCLTGLFGQSDLSMKIPEIDTFNVQTEQQSRSETNAYDLCIHIDINKTIMAVDEVKGYKREEVVLLEEWKGDESFLQWAHENHAKPTETLDDFKRRVGKSEGEPSLISYAKEYTNLNDERKRAVNEVLQKINENNSVESFWELLKWCKSQNDLNILVCFRTFGTDLLAMQKMVEEFNEGEFKESLALGEHGRWHHWTMLHKYPSTRTDADKTMPEGAPGIEDDYIKINKKFYTYPNNDNTLPGPKEKVTRAEDFNKRTIQFEEKAAQRYFKGTYLEPYLFLGTSKELVEEKENNYVLDKKMVRAEDMDQHMRSVKFEKQQTLKIIGIQDDYRAWSRMNWRDGKFFVLPECDNAGLGDFKKFERQFTPHMFFDDYSFTKKSNRTQKVAKDDQDRRIHNKSTKEEDEPSKVKSAGPYIQAMWCLEGNCMSHLSSDELERRYSGEPEFENEKDNLPLVYRAVLNKKGMTGRSRGNNDTAVSNPDYFVDRVKATIAKLDLQKEHRRKLSM